MSQARFVARSYASSLFAGVDRHFFFILGNYIERGIQFGILRYDLTPRPAYSALAATGRFLEGAKVLGRKKLNEGVWLYAFKSFPDGKPQDVAIVWAKDETPWSPDACLQNAKVYDFLGREMPGFPATLETGAIFLVCPSGTLNLLELEAPPIESPVLPTTVSPVVIQAQWPMETRDLASQAHKISVGKETIVPIHIYNFSDGDLTGSMEVTTSAENWNVVLGNPNHTIKPGDRGRTELHITPAKAGEETLAGVEIRLTGDFGSAGKPVLAFRTAVDPTEMEPTKTLTIGSALRPDAWRDNINHDCTLTHQLGDGGMIFTMSFGETDPWSYPELTLAADEIPSSDYDGIAFTIQVTDGTGILRVQFVEEGGSSYISDMGVSAEVRTPQKVVILFDRTKWGAWSKPDADGKLVPADIRKVLVGINSEKKSNVSMNVRDLCWVRLR